MDEVRVNIENYDLLFVNKKRYYSENLKERDFQLENTTPYLLCINGYEIRENSWSEMIRNLSAYLITNYPEYSKSLVQFRTEWSKAVIFSNTKRTNFKKITDELYVNCNHTALHGCWLIQDLLAFYNIDIDRVIFFIHRPSSAEPKSIKDHLLSKIYKEFVFFLKQSYSKNDEQCQKIISNINTHLNPILNKMSKSYDNLFLFDDYATLCNYINRIKEYINNQIGLSEKNRSAYFRYCKYIVEYYKL